MKKLITAALLAAAAALALCSLPAGAQEPDYEFYGTPWDGTVSENIPRDLTVYDSAVISSDAEITDKHIRIEKNGVLEITGGANISLSEAHIFIEKGGALIVSDGTLTLDSPDIPGSYITTYGTLIVGSNGRIDIKRGGFEVFPEGSIIDNGSIELVNANGYANSLSAIKKLDKDFRLSDYSIYAHSLDGKTAQVQLQYCIGDIETSYKYIAAYGAKSGVKLRRSSIDLSKVYSKELREQLLDSVHAYEAQNSLPADFEDGIERSYCYYYSFAKNTLCAEYLYFIKDKDDDPEDAVIMDMTKTTVVDIV